MHISIASTGPGTVWTLVMYTHKSLLTDEPFSHEKLQLVRNPVLMKLSSHSHAAAAANAKAEAMEELGTCSHTQKEAILQMAPMQWADARASEP